MHRNQGSPFTFSAVGALALAGVAIPGTIPAPAHAEEARTLAPVVVTAPRMFDAGRVETDPKQPRLPLPAHDGGSYLKSIPGMTTSRKGGTSGDPELRGLGGSRLRMLLDGSEVLGGCGGRMDPPTAYVYPEAYDRIEILKGPQSVRHGSSAAGVVRFERETPRFDEPDVRGHTSFTAGSFARNDLMADVTAGDRLGYVRMIGTLSSQDDYKDGDGETIHSRYERWSTTALAGWTPTEDLDIEFSYERSDGEAAYDDRARDGTRFDRTGYTLSATRRNLTPRVAEVEGRLFYNNVDHVMDSFRLRDGPRNAMNPERRTVGGRVTAELTPTATTWISVGADYMDDEHTTRMAMEGMGQDASTFSGIPREDNAAFEQYGAFAEVEHDLTRRDRLTYGARVDRNEAEALRDGMQTYGGAAAGTTDRNTLTSGFARYSHDFEATPTTVHLGLGRAERAPDFWERNRRFELDPEVLHQIDAGASYATERFEANLALFYGEFDDYVLIDYSDDDVDARSVDATHHGAEADTTVHLTPTLSSTASLSWVRAGNDTDDEPLAQTPPAEGSISVDYDDGRSFAGTLLRGVARQNRVHEGFGTIYSRDTDKSAGFGVLSLYGGFRPTPHATVTAGIDNVFNRAYAEHIQQRGGGFLTPEDEALNEPGRTVWGRVTASF